MHILYVLPKLTFFSEGRRGRVAHAIGVVTGLAAGGAQITVLSGRGTKAEFEKINGVNAIEVDKPQSSRFAESQWANYLVQKIDALLASDQSFDVLIVRYAVSKGFYIRQVFKRHPGILRCLEVNSLAYHQLSGLPMVIRRLIRLAESVILASSDIIYVVSNTLAADLHAVNQNLHITVIPNAAHTRALNVNRSDNDQRQKARFVYMGVFQPYYDLELVIKAFCSARRQSMDAELHFFGDGDQLALIERAALHDDNIVSHGRYDLEELLSSGFLNQQTILLLPNRTKGMSEIGSPIKLYEYMSFGRPILASAIPHTMQVLREGVTGIFYEPENIESCTRAMIRIAKCAALRESLGRSVREEFLRLHTWDARMAQLKKELQNARERKCQ